jgi:hypothetical protein
VDPPEAATEAPADFVGEAVTLARVALCDGDGPLPPGHRAEYHRSHCRALARAVERYQDRWLGHARPFFARVVPPGLPRAVVYPFGGGDLATALAVFPDAEEYTTLSLEPAGDPRALPGLPRAEIEAGLGRTLHHMASFLQANHSRTRDISEVMRKGPLPGQLLFALLALHIHGGQPVSLRYFAIAPDGSLDYLTTSEIDGVARALAAGDCRPLEPTRPPAKRGSPGGCGEKRQRATWRQVFANLELSFRTPSGAIKTYRHIQANLDDAHLAARPGVLRHLERKGEVVALTKAASYLLWWRAFGRLRAYLLGHVVWMVSDATGIPPRYAEPAGFEQLTWGRWRRHIKNLGDPGSSLVSEFRRLWERNPYQPLDFRFGYPDGHGAAHLMVTRKKYGVARRVD